MPPFPLLKTLAWSHGAVLGASSILDIVSQDAIIQSPYREVIEALVERIHKFEMRVAKRSSDTETVAFRSILDVPNVPAIEERATFFSSMSSERTSKFISSLLDYRIIDMLLSLESGISAHGQKTLLPIPHPKKMILSTHSRHEMTLTEYRTSSRSQTGLCLCSTA
jgi:hypothetical protein